MKQLICATLIGMLFLLAAGDAMSKRLSADELPRAAELPVDVYLLQREVDVEVQNTNPMMAGGGLLGVLITSAIDEGSAKKDASRLGPLRDLLIDFPLAEQARSSVEEGLDPALLGTAINLQFHTLAQSERLRTGELKGQERLLSLIPNVAFSTDFSELRVSLAYQYGPLVIEQRRNNKRKIRGRPLYSASAVYVIPVPAIVGRKQDDRVAAWKTLGAEFLRSEISAGLQETVAMVNYDLQLDGKEKKGKKVIVGAGRGRLVGTRVHQTDRRDWARRGDILTSAPKR